MAEQLHKDGDAIPNGDEELPDDPNVSLMSAMYNDGSNDFETIKINK